MSGILDALAGVFGQQQNAAPMMAPPPEAMPMQAPPPEAGGGLAATLGLSPDAMQRAMRALGAGLSKVKSGTSAGEAIAQGLGGSFVGAQAFDDLQAKRRVEALDRAIKMKGMDNDQDYRKASLGISQQNADTSRMSAERGDYDFLPGTGLGPDGKEVPGTYTFDRRSGTKVFEPGGTVGSRRGGGAGGGESVFQQKLRIGERLYGVGSKEAADYAAGNKQPSAADLRKFGMRQAQQELSSDFNLSNKLKDPSARKEWLTNRAREIEGTLQNGFAPSPGMAPAPAAPRAPIARAPVPEITFKGNGTQADPYQPMSRDDYDEIVSGTFYRHPKDGQIYKKK